MASFLLIWQTDITDAFANIHSKGFLHCDLKLNNVLVTDKHGHIINFGKACDSAFPPAKKYTFHFAHIAPEVLKGSHCSIASHAVVFRGLVLPPRLWGGGNTSPLKTTAWEANCSKASDVYSLGTSSHVQCGYYLIPKNYSENKQNNGDTCQNIKIVFQSRSNRADKKTAKSPKLSKARDNNDQLCKDVDLLDSHIRDKRTPSCNLTADK